LVALTYEHMGGEKEIELEDVLQFINNINGCTDIFRHVRFPYYQCMFIATCFVVVGFGTHVGLLFRVASAGVWLTVRMWTQPESKGLSILTGAEDEELQVVSDGCDTTLLVSNQLHKHI
ncbi:hypothetical protein Tco_1305388, partial [Tanacetum coccineum]